MVVRSRVRNGRSDRGVAKTANRPSALAAVHTGAAVSAVRPVVVEGRVVAEGAMVVVVVEREGGTCSETGVVATVSAAASSVQAEVRTAQASSTGPRDRMDRRVPAEEVVSDTLRMCLVSS